LVRIKIRNVFQYCFPLGNSDVWYSLLLDTSKAVTYIVLKDSIFHAYISIPVIVLNDICYEWSY